MVEVLVALVVLSIGMLGMAGMYVTTLQAKSTSSSRMKAVNLAYDLADRIRANRAGRLNYVLASGAATATQDCTTADCTPAELAKSDLSAWNSLINNAITGLPGTVTRSVDLTAAATKTTPAVLTINLSWTEATSATPLTYVLLVQI